MDQKFGVDTKRVLWYTIRTMARNLHRSPSQEWQITHRETPRFYHRDLPSNEDCQEWIHKRRYTNARLKQLWEEEGILDEALVWIQEMQWTHGKGAARWIWKLAEEEFPPQEKLDEEQDERDEVDHEIDKLLTPPNDPDRIRIKTPEQEMSVTEWLLWVADNLYSHRDEIVAPCRAAAAAWEYYKEESNRHKLYQMLANRVVPKEEKPAEAKVDKKKQRKKSEAVKSLDKMLAEAAKEAGK